MPCVCIYLNAVIVTPPVLIIMACILCSQHTHINCQCLHHAKNVLALLILLFTFRDRKALPARAAPQPSAVGRPHRARHSTEQPQAPLQQGSLGQS